MLKQRFSDWKRASYWETGEKRIFWMESVILFWGGSRRNSISMSLNLMFGSFHWNIPIQKNAWAMISSE